MRRLERFSHVPLLGRMVQGQLRSTARRSVRRHDLTPDAERALFAAAEADLPRLAQAVVGLGELGRNFDESQLPHVPSIVLTADRPERSAMRKTHERLAAALGGELRMWPKAEHHVHITHPAEVLAAARELLAKVAAR